MVEFTDTKVKSAFSDAVVKPLVEAYPRALNNDRRAS